MNRFIPVTTLWFLLAAVTPLLAVESGASQRPNIIVIMSDDMGYSDIGCYGGEIQTPNLDRLAANGLRFTQFYNTARCCPTRASLLTGLYPHQAGVGWMMNDQGLDGYRGELNRSSLTIAEALKPAGYSTYMAGKWHVTKHVNPKDDSEKFNWPQQRGFDRYYGIINGASSLWDPNSLVRGNELITCVNDPHYEPEEPYHFTDAISDNAVKFVKEHDPNDPFFMYVSYTAAHWPMHARPRDIKKYEGAYDAGYQAVRRKRLKKMKQIGLVANDTELTPAVGQWNGVDDKRWEAACMEVYAAMVDQMDQGIGRIVDALKETGQYDNTLILFLQDNGGCAEPCGRQGEKPVRAESPSLDPLPKDLVHYFGSVPKQTRDGWPILRGHVMPGPADTYIGYGRNWANVSNTPFREYKHWVHEGGISTPLIAHWPAGIKQKNELRHQPAHLIDLMATCVDVASADYPQERDGMAITPLEGESLMTAFADKPIDRWLFWEHEGNRAVRDGHWKLVAKGRMADRSQPVTWELYDLSADRVEENDLAGKQPERVRKMADQWQKYADRCAVFPCPQPKPKPKAKKNGSEKNK
ncbi:MAG: arylsulfatase [Mariniblastus sp.]|nr:arylsulfatase [Mariniblastus sp.]